MANPVSSPQKNKAAAGPSWMGCPYCTCIGRVQKNRSRSPRVRLFLKPFFVVYRCTTCNGAFVRFRQLVWVKSFWRTVSDFRALGRLILFTSGEGPEPVDRKSFVVANERSGSKNAEHNSVQSNGSGLNGSKANGPVTFTETDARADSVEPTI